MADPGTTEKDVGVSDLALTPTSSTAERPVDPVAERRLLWKLDLRIIPLLWILFLVNFIDRANIGNAKIQGMEKELNLISHRFNIAVWAFNPAYFFARIPLQVVFRKYGPKILCVMMFVWGITVIGCGLVQSFEQLVVCRLLEGMAEAAYIPGGAYLIGAYYTNDEYLTRYVVFHSAGVIAGAINGFISSLIAKMYGVAGYSAWRWIFIIEGCITICVSIGCWPVIPPFPEDCNFLSPENKVLMLARIKASGGHRSDEEITLKKAFSYLKDWKIWAGVAMFIGVTENANAFANFLPTIVKGLGHTATQAQVHSIPVYFAGALFSFAFAYISQRLRQRYYFYIFGCAFTVSGLAVELVYPAPKVRYMGLFLISFGTALSMPISVVWSAINAGGGLKRNVALAAVANFGTVAAFISSNVFLYKETPRFHTGYSSGLGMKCMGFGVATSTWLWCKQENKKRDKKRDELPAILPESMYGYGDEHPDFRFAL